MMKKSPLFNAVLFFCCVMVSNVVNAAAALIDFLSDDLPFETYASLNLLNSPQDLSDPAWQLVNASGMASKSGQSLTLGAYPDLLFQTVNLIAGETYILTLTGAGSNGDIIWVNVRDSDSFSTVVYEYMSMRDEVDSYPLRFSVPFSHNYTVELRVLPGYDNIVIDWGMLGLFREADLLAAGAKWSTFSVWADSMGGPNNRGGWPRRLKAFLDVPDYIDGAVGGETSTEILTRMLSTSDFGELAFIWAGNNNANQVDIVLSDIAQMVSILPHKNFLVISLHNNANYDNSTPTYAQVIEINSRLEQTYGDRFVDTRSYLIANADISDPGDLADATAGIVPQSFRSDDIHLNTKGQDYVTSLLVARISSLNSAPLSSNNTGNGGNASGGGGCNISGTSRLDPIWLFMIFVFIIRYPRYCLCILHKENRFNVLGMQ